MDHQGAKSDKTMDLMVENLDIKTNYWTESNTLKPQAKTDIAEHDPKTNHDFNRVKKKIQE